METMTLATFWKDFALNMLLAVDSTAGRGSEAPRLKTNHLVFVSSRLSPLVSS